MSKCGVCGWSFNGWALSKHAETACGEQDIKAEVRSHEPAINDLIREMEEQLGEDIH